MEQMFQLKYHGDFSFFEMYYMTAYERNWWIKRLARQKEQEKKDAESK
jgi:hypothetical protein